MNTGSAVVVGGTGFLGSHVASILLDRGFTVTVVGRRGPSGVPGRVKGARVVRGDRRDPEFIRTLMDTGPDLWIDTAVFSADDALALTESWRQGSPTRFVVAGTVAEYGIHLKPKMPLCEDQPLYPEQGYGEGKVAAFECLKSASSNMGFPFTWAVLPQLWGEGDPHGRDAVLVGAIKEGRPIILRGDGLTDLPDGFVVSAAEAMVQLAEEGACQGLRVNVCGPDPLTPMGYVREAARALDRTFTVVHVDPPVLASLEEEAGLEYRPVFGDMNVTMERTRLEAAGFAPSVGWKEGVARTARWHAENSTAPAPGYMVDRRFVEMAMEVGSPTKMGSNG